MPPLGRVGVHGKWTKALGSDGHLHSWNDGHSLKHTAHLSAYTHVGSMKVAQMRAAHKLIPLKNNSLRCRHSLQVRRMLAKVFDRRWEIPTTIVGAMLDYPGGVSKGMGPGSSVPHIKAALARAGQPWCANCYLKFKRRRSIKNNRYAAALNNGQRESAIVSAACNDTATTSHRVREEYFDWIRMQKGCQQPGGCEWAVDGHELQDPSAICGHHIVEPGKKHACQSEDVGKLTKKDGESVGSLATACKKVDRWLCEVHHRAAHALADRNGQRVIDHRTAGCTACNLGENFVLGRYI